MLHPHYIEYLHFDLPAVRHGAAAAAAASMAVAACDWKRALLCFSSPTLRTRCQKKKKMKKIKKTKNKHPPTPRDRSPCDSFLPQQPETPAGRRCVRVESRAGSSADSCWKTFCELLAAVPPPEAQCVFADSLPPWFPVLTVWWEWAFFSFFFCRGEKAV